MKTWHIWFIQLGLLLLFTHPHAFATQANLPDPAPVAPVSVSCHYQTGGGYWWDYCVYTPKQTNNADVLYYFHGLEGSEYEWEQSPNYNQIYQTWGTSAPVVISISYGSLWLLAPVNTSAVSGLYPNFVNTALPTIETTEKIKPAHRLLLGLSMGGFNAAQVYLNNPNLFSKVALACPALTTIGPYDGTDAVTAYITRTNATASYVYNALAISEEYFPTEADWLKAAPVSVASQVVNSSYPPVYASGGLQDQYGFFEGAEAFVNAVNAKGGHATWTGIPGGHCVYDWQGTARFFIAE
jgi:S-formylglutathione hydrolase FrmB